MLDPMSASRPFALFITWTTYGTWLPGDKRGYVSETREPDGAWTPRVNRYGEEYMSDRGDMLALAPRRQKHPTVWLTPLQARCVAESLLAASSERTWRVLRAAVMANHVHAVVSECPDDGPA